MYCSQFFACEYEHAENCAQNATLLHTIIFLGELR